MTRANVTKKHDHFNSQKFNQKLLESKTILGTCHSEPRNTQKNNNKTLLFL